MSTQELIEEVKSLREEDLHFFLSLILSDQRVLQELEKMGCLKLTEKAFEFWNDPREDVYQDYARRVPEGHK